MPRFRIHGGALGNGGPAAPRGRRNPHRQDEPRSVSERTRGDENAVRHRPQPVRCALHRGPGGSSSGSGVAVSAGLVAFALGTDVAGSGRVPAAFNNVVGLKPSRGLISATGCVPAARSLDCVSIFALTSEDASAVLRVAAAPDPHYSFSRAAQLGEPEVRSRFRFAVPRPGDLEFFGNGEWQALYQEGVERLRGMGGEKVEIAFAPFRAVSQTATTYPETYVRVMTGADLKLILEDVADNLFNPDPYYQQGGDMVRVGGLDYVCDPTQPIGSRVSDMTLDDGEKVEAVKVVQGRRMGDGRTRSRRDHPSGRSSRTICATASPPGSTSSPASAAGRDAGARRGKSPNSCSCPPRGPPTRLPKWKRIRSS